MKNPVVVASLLCAGALGALAAERTVLPLEGPGWRLWLDRAASWQDDTLYVDPDVKTLEVAPPTGGWEVLKGPSVGWGDAAKAWTDKSLSLEVSVPGTVEQYFFDVISGKRKGERETGDYRGVSWWSKGFEVPAAAKGRRVAIAFKEGVRHRAEVFVNRKLVGYEIVLQSPFEVDVTDVVKYGEVNELAVRITDPNGNFSWGDYTFAKWGRYMFPLSHGFGGILGGVDVVVTDPVRVADVFVKNKPVLRDIDTEVTLANASDQARTVIVAAAVVENWAKDAPVAGPKTLFTTDLGPVTVPAGGEKSVDFNAVVKEAKLWEIHDAHLYDLVVTLTDETGALVDRTATRFGFRSLETKGAGTDAKFYLNGRRVFLLSGISWGFWPSNGIFPTKELARKHVESAVKLGLNMLNFHRCRGNDAVLTAADEMGVLYYEEPGGFSTYRFKDQDMTHVDQSVAYEILNQKVLRMVKNHRNHASLTFYNMVNEPGWEPDERAKATMAEAHRLDPTRAIFYGSGFMGPKSYQPQKLHMLPYDETQYVQGFCDIHNAGQSPGVYVDTNWNGPKSYLRQPCDKEEFLIWGEEGALAAPPQLEKIHEQKQGQPNGWDGQQYDLWYAGFKSYLEKKGLTKGFPSVTDLCTKLGNIMYYEHGRLLENCRIADEAEAYILNGYESMKDDNLSGAVDCYRNIKGDPTLISRYMKPLMMSVKAREKLAAVGDVNAVDLYVVNEFKLPAGAVCMVKALVKTPTGKTRKLYAGEVKLTGGETFSDLAAEDLKVALDDGPGYYTIGAALVGPNGKVLAKGKDEMLAVDYASVRLKGQGAIIGGGMEYVNFAQKVLKADFKKFDPAMGRLDYVLLAPTDQGQTFRPIPAFNFRAKDGEEIGLDIDYYRGKKFEEQLDHRVTTAPIDFDVKAKLIPGYDILGVSGFSLRWEGYVVSDYTGDIEFEYTCDDGARVWYDGELVVDKWTNGPKAVKTFTKKMVAGEKHAIKIEAYQDGGDWIASFKWKLPVPEEKVDLEALVRRVREDGTKLVLIEGAEENLKKLEKLGAFPKFDVFHPHKTWVGHNMFVAKHPFFEGLPTDCAMNWEYQRLTVYDGPKHFGLVMDGETPAVGLVGVPLRGIATAVGTVPCGKGVIVFSSLDLAPYLTSDMKAAVTPKRIFANILKWSAE